MSIFALSPKHELGILLFVSALVLLALLLSHTSEVTLATYWYGPPMVYGLILIFALRFRQARVSRPAWLRTVQNTCLVFVCFIFLVYLLGLASWYK